MVKMEGNGGTEDKALICLHTIKPHFGPGVDRNGMETGQWQSL